MADDRDGRGRQASRLLTAVRDAVAVRRLLDHGDHVVRLHRRAGLEGPVQRYTCALPTCPHLLLLSGREQAVYVFLGITDGIGGRYRHPGQADPGDG